ncbi:hypothetical protein CYMTET_11082 [Cymbomonas tetramitiformis]|uniref:Uncharacterized protein n=1 Tax=Cymbomonas tetramitiformis TaxID=36881 RepID=A0AAE0GN05_9CHLO|nr:hypothetical protein CYMTET_11082 [Cymbomonas tetramitiformis]
MLRDTTLLPLLLLTTSVPVVTCEFRDHLHEPLPHKIAEPKHLTIERTSTTENIDDVLQDVTGTPEQSRHWDDYEQSRKKCVWQTTVDSEIGLRLSEKMKFHSKGQAMYKYFKNTSEWNADPDPRWFVGPMTKPGGAVDPWLQECHVQDTLSSNWTFQRYGPFTGTGGYDWHSMIWFDVGSMSSILEREKRIWVTGKFLGVVSPEGKPLEYPPLHNHHTHLRKLSNFILLDPPSSGNPDVPPTRVEQDVSEMAGLFWESHADSACDSRRGGATCFLHVLPDGYGAMIDKRDNVPQALILDADVNDVRASGSEPLEFYYEVGLKWTTESKLPAAMFNFNNLSPPGGKHSHQERLGLIDTPTDKSTVLWWTVTLPRDGRLIEANLHVHQRFFHSFLLLSGTPDDDPGQLSSLAPIAHPWAPYITTLKSQQEARGMEEIREAVIARVEQCTSALPSNHSARMLREVPELTECPPKPMQIICRGDAPGLELVSQEDGQARLGARLVPGYYDRRTSLKCKQGWRFKKNDHVTLLFFNSAAPGVADYEETWLQSMAGLGDKVKGMRQIFKQHNIFRMWYTNDTVWDTSNATDVPKPKCMRLDWRYDPEGRTQPNSELQRINCG